MAASRRTFVVLVAVAAVLAAIRLALPSILRREVNLRLSHIAGYTGRVDDVRVQVWHGGYRMYGLLITKKGGDPGQPFVAADRVQFSIAYRELFRGRFVSDIEIDHGRLNFVRGPSPAATQYGREARWQDVIDDLFPIHITHLHFQNGEIQFVDTSTKPKVDISIRDVTLEADGLRNRPSRRADPYPAHIILSGKTIGNGDLDLDLDAEPLADQPHFRLKLSARSVDLPALNDFLRAYANVDVGAGTFDTYVEMTGADGSFQGYAKPFFKNLRFSSPDDQHKNAWQLLWKELVAGAANLVKNKSQNQIATLVPFSGRFSRRTDVDVWRALGNLFRNGFIQALREGLEGSATIKSEPPAPAKK